MPQACSHAVTWALATAKPVRISTSNAIGQRDQMLRVPVRVDFLLQTFSQNDALQMSVDALKTFLGETFTRD